MKKLLNKLARAGRKTNSKKMQDLVSGTQYRITNETVAEHRERVLSEGRKFKYPYHHTKYHIVVITAGIVAITIISFFGFSFWQLYSAQNTGEFIHRLTQVLYVPVAKVDDQSVLYSDYLLELRSAIHYLSTKELVNFSSEDGKRQLEYQKRLALDKAIANTYASKLAKLQNVNVTDQDVNSFISNQVTVNRLGVSMDVYRQIIHDYYGWSFDDYKLSVKRQLLRRILVAKIDVEGRQRIESILSSLRSGADFATIAKQQSEDPLAKSNSGDIGFISKTADDPSGFIKVLSNLQPGQVSGVIEGVDGFYVVKLIEAKGNDLHIAKIYISYKTFTKQLAALKSAGKIKEYIKVSDTAKPKNN